MRIRLYAYTGGTLPRPQWGAMTEGRDAEEQLEEFRREAGSDVRQELVAEREFEDGAGISAWIEAEVAAWRCS